MVFCGLPSGDERRAVLAAAGRKLSLAADVSFERLARATANFTAADLAALLSEAQLLAVHERLERVAAEAAAGLDDGTQGGGGGGGAPVVCMAHLERALSRARPSLPAAEQRRLSAVYARFQAGRDPGLSNRPLLDEASAGVKHATLA